MVYINLKSILKTTGVLHRRYLTSDQIPGISLNSGRVNELVKLAKNAYYV